MARSCAARAVSLCLAEAATFGSPAAGGGRGVRGGERGLSGVGYEPVNPAKKRQVSWVQTRPALLRLARFWGAAFGCMRRHGSS